MFTLIIGSAASGKSEYAERHVLSLRGRRVYLATMLPVDKESRARIAKHRALRARKGFATVERYTALSKVSLPARCNVLLECMSNLLANEMYCTDGGGTEAALAGVESLLSHCEHLTVVTNEVFSGGADYEGDTLRYLSELARVNRALARQADLVVEMVSGLPNVLKGAVI